MSAVPASVPAGEEVAEMLEAAMRREQFRGERRRVIALLGLLGFLLLLVVGIAGIPSLIREEVRSRLLDSVAPVSAVLISYILYEAGVLVWMTRLLARGGLPSAAFRYGNVAVEVSLPTAALVSLAMAIGGLPALSGAAPFVYFLFIFLAALNLDPWLCLFAGTVAGMEFVATSLLVLGMDGTAVDASQPALIMLLSPHQYIFKGMLLVAGGGVAAFVAARIRRQLMAGLRTLRERDRAVSIFGQHVSPQVADLLLKQPVELGGQERAVCVMFLDIRGFSQIASERTPAEVMEYLNTLFSFMIPLVNEHQGIINKFLGDGFMAVFGAPADDAEQCHHAVEASRAMLRRVAELNDQERIPPTRIGIGLHLGPALTGNVGGGDRKEYTIIGDTVNLASRIEQATKQFSACLLVSEPVVKSLGPQDPAPVDLGLVELRGQPQPVRLFKLA